MNEIERLRSEEAELERRLAEIREQRAKLEKRPHPAPSESRRLESSRPLRDILLDLISESQAPLNSLLITSVLRPLLGREVPSTRFGTLSADEQKSYDSKRPRPIYLCHCLTHDSGQAMKRFWARSDWPLYERIIGPMTGRVLFLRGAAWAIRIAREAKAGRTVIDPEKLSYVAADQARDAGLSVRRGEFPYDDWLNAIQTQLERHSPDDEKVRRKAAAQFEKRLSERELLFGARAPLVSLPGSASGWRSASE